jgi:hypothetical protein
MAISEWVFENTPGGEILRAFHDEGPVQGSALIVLNVLPGPKGRDVKVRMGPMPGGRRLGDPIGVKRSERGGVNFAKSPYLFPVGPGQKNIVKITYSGRRSSDFRAANEEAGLKMFGSKPPKGYTWHHLDDWNPVTNTRTMQLVRRKIHEATYPHRGGVSQWEKATGQKYK